MKGIAQSGSRGIWRDPLPTGGCGPHRRKPEVQRSGPAVWAMETASGLLVVRPRRRPDCLSDADAVRSRRHFRRTVIHGNESFPGIDGAQSHTSPAPMLHIGQAGSWFLASTRRPEMSAIEQHFGDSHHRPWGSATGQHHHPDYR